MLEAKNNQSVDNKRDRKTYQRNTNKKRKLNNYINIRHIRH